MKCVYAVLFVSWVYAAEKTDVYFRGLFQDVQGKQIEVENVRIGGKNKRIAVYEKPEHKDISPELHKSFIDLSQVSSIRLARTMPAIVKFKGREYIEIIIALCDAQKSEHAYIIELSRKITCEQKSAVGLIEKELSFQALGCLSITQCVMHRMETKGCVPWVQE